MKFRTAIMLAALALTSFISPASAAKVEIARVSLDQLEADCKAAGGTFWSDLNGYSCIKANCDGKGGNCIVFCSAKGGACEGRVPKTRKVPAGIRGILNPPVTSAQ